jgi:hypothetical protein
MMSSQELKPLLRAFRKFPDAFWRDVILITYQNSVTGKIRFTPKGVEQHFNNIMQKSQGKLFFEPAKIADYLIHLEHCGYIEKYPDSDGYSITKSGYTLIVDNGGCMAVAERNKKENRRFDFEYFKMGYDTVISLVALLLSIVALIAASQP